MPYDIVGIGVCTVDHIATVQRLPARNENMRALHYALHPGGLASCALVAAARLGARCKIIARIGDDAAGEFIRKDLQAEGLDVSQLLVAPNSESHVSVILVHAPSGERSIVTRPPTGPLIRPDEIQHEQVTNARILFVDSINPATMQAARWARAAGMKVLLDPANPYAEIAPLLELVDVPIVPEQWARAWLPGQEPAAVAERLVAAGAEIAVVTLGERGALLSWAGGDTQHIPAFTVDVVDTTGAGDAYHGAFMAAMLRGWDAPRMAEYAAAVGAMNCRAIGGRAALPSHEQVMQFIAQRGA